MPAPNKIYVPTRFGLVDGLRIRENDTDVEYICKDTLMEWLKETKSTIENENVINDDIRKGAIWEIEEIIKKLHSL